MRLSTRIHGMFDYLVAALLIAAPWLFGFTRGGAETWVMAGLGGVIIAYSIFTDYELGLVRRLQMPLHLWLDGIGGVLLAVSPWVFEFDQAVRVPHVVIGLLAIGLAFFTHTIPGYERRRDPAMRTG
jgi:hypothetical protein